MDPIFEKNDGEWFFYDETWSYTYGPYHDKDAAQIALDKYCERLEGNEIYGST